MAKRNPPRGVTRRKALKQIGAAAGAAALAPLLQACGDDGGGGSSEATPLPIDNLVVLMMENRSFDHYFGSLSLLEGRRVDGLRAGMSNPRMDGTVVPIFPLSDRCVADPPHGWEASHAQVNNGLNNGFVIEHQKRLGVPLGDQVMGYLQRSQLPISYALADEFVLCDRWFSAVRGPTWPNRFYLHCAQSNGRKNNDLPSAGGLKFKTIYDTLDTAGISWKYYYSDLPFLALFNSIKTRQDRLPPVQQFFEDARAGTLPQVTVVEPGFGLNDDHPPHDIHLGQAFLSSVIHALGQSPQWRRSALLITYDEHGGFFDHVNPPTVADERSDVGFGALGVRVPGLVISPWAKRGFVSSVVREHSSWPAFVEQIFHLPPLTIRDTNANVFGDAFDFDRIDRDDPRPFPNLPVIEVDPNIPPECVGVRTASAEAQDIEIAADAGAIPAELDRRSELPETARMVAEELVRMGAGRAKD